jgi:putative transposase
MASMPMSTGGKSMPAQRLTFGTKFRWEGVDYEILRLLPPPGQRANIENLVTGEVQTVSIDTLTEALFAGRLEMQVTGRNAKKAAGTDISTQNKYDALDDVPLHLMEIAWYRLGVIQPLLDMKPSERTLAVVLARVEEVRAALTPESNKGLASKVSKTSIYDWMRYYIKSGQDIRALIPDTTVCGGKRKPRLDSEVSTLVDSTIREKYLVPETVTINQVHSEIALRIHEINQARPSDEQLPLPSRTTIARRIDNLDVIEKFAAKHGALAARRRFKQYGKTERPTVPLERVEIDHTRSDLIVVDDADDMPLGRLTITYTLDVATGYPLGYSFGWDGTSYLAIAECLRHAIYTKGDIRERYGTEHQWLAYGVPSTLVTDNGKDFLGNSLKDACALLGIALQRTPVMSPHFKGGVERHMSNMNTMLLHGLPGTTFGTISKRGDYKSEENAAIYLSEIDKLFNIYVVDIYAESHNRGIEGIPARRWEHAVNMQGFLPRLPSSAHELDIMLGSAETRQLHHYGIEFEHLYYNCSELGPLRAALRGEVVKFKYHAGDLSRIHVYHPFEQRYIEVPCLNQEYTAGLSQWKHKVLVREARRHTAKVDIVALGIARRKIQEVVDAGRTRRSMAARSKIARWEYGGQSTRDIDWGKLTTLQVEPAELPQPGILALPQPNPDEVSLPSAGTESVPDIDLGIEGEGEGEGEDDGWSVDYSIKPARSHSHLRALGKED